MKEYVNMSSFQTQSQWENDSDNTLTESYDLTGNQRKHGIPVNRKAIVVFFALVILVVAAGIYFYSTARSIEGIWVRQVDDNSTVAGMMIEVKNNNGTLQGTIISMPMDAIEFKVGQVKWFGIKKVGFGKYTFFDLMSYGDGASYDYANNPDDMTVSSGGDQLTISSNHEVDRGAYQLWIKQKPE